MTVRDAPPPVQVKAIRIEEPTESAREELLKKYHGVIDVAPGSWEEEYLLSELPRGYRVALPEEEEYQPTYRFAKDGGNEKLAEPEGGASLSRVTVAGAPLPREPHCRDGYTMGLHSRLELRRALRTPSAADVCIGMWAAPADLSVRRRTGQRGQLVSWTGAKGSRIGDELYKSFELPDGRVVRLYHSSNKRNWREPAPEPTEVRPRGLSALGLWVPSMAQTVALGKQDVPKPAQAAHALLVMPHPKETERAAAVLQNEWLWPRLGSAPADLSSSIVVEVGALEAPSEEEQALLEVSDASGKPLFDDEVPPPVFSAYPHPVESSIIDTRWQ